MSVQQWRAISLVALLAISWAPAAGASTECSRNNIGERCCSGGACMGGLCYPPGYPDSGDSYWCAACIPVPGVPCDSINSGSPCDDAGNVCTALDNVYGTFASGDSFGVAPFACLGGTQPEAGIADGSPCYSALVPDAGAGVVDGGGATVDATVPDAAATEDATLADGVPPPADVAVEPQPESGPMCTGAASQCPPGWVCDVRGMCCGVEGVSCSDGPEVCCLEYSCNGINPTCHRLALPEASDPFFSTCTQDSDCPPGETCSAGTCRGMSTPNASSATPSGASASGCGTCAVGASAPSSDAAGLAALGLGVAVAALLARRRRVEASS